MKNYYEILQVSAEASDEIIRSAYRALSKKYHPDVYKGNSDYATRKMKMINEAYEVISNPQKRKAYDDAMKSDQGEVVTDIPVSDDTDKSYRRLDGNSENRGGCSGCIGKVLGIIFWIIVAVFAVRSCSSNEGESVKPQSEIQETVAMEQQENSGQKETQDIYETDGLAQAADNIEKLFFHKLYTDLGEVEIHDFAERNAVVNFIVELGTDKKLSESGCYVNYQKKLLSEGYYYATVSETDYYYIGELKNNKPHGMGALVGVADGAGTYDFSGEALFYYVGNFKEGIKDGYGVEFHADEGDITYIVQYIIEQDLVSDEYGEFLCQYLFNHVSYEGYWKGNEKHGKGNKYSFPEYLSVYYFSIAVNEPLEGYIFGNVYPSEVIRGEWVNGKMTGDFAIYEHNEKSYIGEMKNGSGNGWGTKYYGSGQVSYEGEWKNGEPHGYGSYYDEEGNLIYSGMWENGDYAH